MAKFVNPGSAFEAVQRKSQLPYMSQKEKQTQLKKLRDTMTQITYILTSVVDNELYAAQTELLQLSSINSEENECFRLYTVNAVGNIDAGNTHLSNACFKLDTINSMLYKCVDWDTQPAQDLIDQLTYIEKIRIGICEYIISSDAAEVLHNLDLLADTALKFYQ